jgi:N-acetylmuramoyl-L-alanine amidase
MSKYYWLLDAGHGGKGPTGYTTAPAKMYTFPDGLVIEEGVVNRAVAKLLATMLLDANIDFGFVHDPVLDTPLSVRVQRANNKWKKSKNCIYLSIHSNAGGGSGNEVFTSIGQTDSDKVAEYFCNSYERHFLAFGKPLRKDERDGDKDKEENFYVLKNTLCPAVLVESLFYDNRSEAEFLLSVQGQTHIALTLYRAIKKIEHDKPILYA